MATELKPIRTKADYKDALAQVERLWGAKSGTPKGDRLDVLATLIDAYETRHYPMDPPDPIEAIQFRMEQQGLTRKDLEPMIGTRARVAEVMSRRRNLSIDMIRRLHKQLGISAEIRIPPTRENDLIPHRRDMRFAARGHSHPGSRPCSHHSIAPPKISATRSISNTSTYRCPISIWPLCSMSPASDSRATPI